MPDLSCVCDLRHSSQQCWILNPLSEARDRTSNLMVPSRILLMVTSKAYGNAQARDWIWATMMDPLIHRASWGSNPHLHPQWSEPLQLDSFFFFLSFFLSFFFFYGHTCSLWKFPGQGLNQSCSWGLPVPHPQHHWNWAASVTYAQFTAMSDPQPTEWGRGSKIQCRVLNAWAQWNSCGQILNPLCHNRNSQDSYFFTDKENEYREDLENFSRSPNQKEVRQGPKSRDLLS